MNFFQMLSDNDKAELRGLVSEAVAETLVKYGLVQIETSGFVSCSVTPRCNSTHPNRKTMQCYLFSGHAETIQHTDGKGNSW